jgi:uncharacterized protein YecE (DUF72 family)
MSSFLGTTTCLGIIGDSCICHVAALAPETESESPDA